MPEANQSRHPCRAHQRQPAPAIEAPRTGKRTDDEAAKHDAAYQRAPPIPRSSLERLAERDSQVGQNPGNVGCTNQRASSDRAGAILKSDGKCTQHNTRRGMAIQQQSSENQTGGFKEKRHAHMAH